MKKRIFAGLVVVALLFLVTGKHADATSIEWADFSAVSGAQPRNGVVSSTNNEVSFDVTFYAWSGNDVNLSVGASSTTHGLLDWGDSYLLHGDGITSYSVEFDNIISHDGSLYFGAVWLWTGHPVTISAYDSMNNPISLTAKSLVDTFYGDGATSWNGTNGQLTMFGGTGSDHGGIIDLSNLGIDRLTLRYDTATWDGFNFGIASNKAAPVPEPASLLLLGTGMAGLIGTRLRRKKQ